MCNQVVPANPDPYYHKMRAIAPGRRDQSKPTVAHVWLSQEPGGPALGTECQFTYWCDAIRGADIPATLQELHARAKRPRSPAASAPHTSSEAPAGYPPHIFDGPLLHEFIEQTLQSIPFASKEDLLRGMLLQQFRELQMIEVVTAIEARLKVSGLHLKYIRSLHYS